MSPRPSEKVFEKSFTNECEKLDNATKNCQSSKNVLTNGECSEIYERIIKEAPYLPGDCNVPILPKDIPWIEPHLLEDGRLFVKHNYFSIYIGLIMIAMAGLGIKPICVSFLRSGKFHKASYSGFLKLLSTVNRVMTWFEDDILSQDSNAYKNIEVTRIMHKIVADWKNRGKEIPSMDDMEIKEETALLVTATQKDLEFVDTREAPLHLLTWKSKLEFSQLDNTIILFGFFASSQFLASVIGIGDSDMEYFNGYRHTWAVIGRLLGIEDKFNLALHHSPELSKKILTNIFVASLKNIDVTLMVAQNTSMKAAEGASFMLRYKPICYIMLKGLVPEYQGEYLYSMMSWWDKICLFSLCMETRLVSRFPIVKRLFNWAAASLVNYLIGKHMPKFRKNYPCPAKNIDY